MKVGIAVLCGLLLGMTAASRAGEPANDSADLVRKLGDASFRVREGAHKALAERGAAALAAIELGADDPDLEIRKRCRTLLAEMQKSDVDVFLAPFLAGKQNPEMKLPGWMFVRRIMGDDDSSRYLYALFYKRDRAFLLAIEEKRQLAPRNVETRIASIAPSWNGPKRPQNAPSTEQTASVLLLAVAAEPRLDPNALRALLLWLNQPAVRQTVAWSQSARRLIDKWLARQCVGAAIDPQLEVLANEFNCRDAIEKTFKPAAAKQLELATANLGDVESAYRVMALARHYRLHDAVEQTFKPAVLKALESASKDADLPRLSSLANLAKAAGATERQLGEMLRPRLTKVVENQVGKVDDMVRVHALLNLFRIAQSQDLLDETLRPAFREKLRTLTPEERRFPFLTQAYHQAQAFEMRDEAETILRPAIAIAIGRLGKENTATTELQHALAAAKSLRLKDTLGPVVRKAIPEIGQGEPDVVRVGIVLQMARFVGTPIPPETLNSKFKPAARAGLLAAPKQALDDSMVVHALNVADELQLGEGVSMCLSAARDKGISTRTRCRAILYVAKHGDKSAIPQLEKLIDDSADLGAGNVNNKDVRTQLGDVALRAAFHLSGKNAGELTAIWPAVTRDLQKTLPVFLGFEDEKARRTAREKWRRDHRFKE